MSGQISIYFNILMSQIHMVLKSEDTLQSVLIHNLLLGLFLA